MTNLATAMPVGEQVMASMPQAAATARGAPADPGAFSLTLGEHLWTLPVIAQAGGDTDTNATVPTAASSGSFDPQVVLQGLLAEIVNLAVDTAGGEDSLLGRLAQQLQQSIDGLSTNPEQTDPPVAIADGETEGTGNLSLLLGRLLSQMEQAAPVPQTEQAAPVPQSEQAAPLPLDNTPDSKLAAVAAKTTAPVVSPAMLAPVVRQVLVQLLADLNADSQQASLQGRISAPAGQTAVQADITTVDDRPVTTQQLHAAVPEAESQDKLTAFTHRADRPGQAELNGKAAGERTAAPLLAGKSPSVDWFNSAAAGRADTTLPAAPGPLNSPGSLTAALPAGSEPVVMQQESVLQLPESQSLRLLVQAQRGTALDPVTRLDVIVRDPAGQVEDLQVSMELMAVKPDKLISGQEMQRISEAMQRVLSETQSTDIDQVSNRVVVSPLVLESTLRSVAIPTTQEAAQVMAAGNKRVPPAADPEQKAEQQSEPQRQVALPESDNQAPPAKPDNASLLSQMLGRRPADFSVASTPESDTGSLSGAVATNNGAGGDGISIQSGSMMIANDPQTVSAVPDRMLQFSAPSPGSPVSGYAMDEIQQQLMERVSELRKAGNGLYNIKLDLYPKELGRMIINIAVRGDNVAMQIAVLNQGQRDELQKQLDALRESLEEEGLAVVDMRILQLGGNDGEQAPGRGTAR